MARWASSRIDVSGSGSVALDRLAAARASVTYRGDPAVTQDITGTGRLVKR